MEKLKYEINEEVTFKSDDVLRHWYLNKWMYWNTTTVKLHKTRDTRKKKLGSTKRTIYLRQNAMKYYVEVMKNQDDDILKTEVMTY